MSEREELLQEAERLKLLAEANQLRSSVFAPAQSAIKEMAPETSEGAPLFDLPSFAPDQPGDIAQGQQRLEAAQAKTLARSREALPPEEFAATLPVIGATAGSVLAAPFTGGLSFLPSLALMTGGAGIGGFAGGFAEGDIRRAEGEDIDPMVMASQRGLQMAGAEVAGGAVAKGLGLLMSPLQNVLTSAGRQQIKEFSKRGVPLSLESIAPRGIVKKIGKLSDNFIPARLVNDFHRKRLAKTLSNQLDEIVAATEGTARSNVDDLPGFISQVSEPFQQQVQGISRGLESEAKKLTQAFVQSAGGPDAMISVPALRATLARILKVSKNEKLRNFAELELASLAGESAKRADDLELLFRQANKIKGVTGREKFFQGEIRQAIQSDFAKAGANNQLLARANQFFRENRELLRNSTIRQIVKGGVSDVALTAKLFKKGNEDLISDLGARMGKANPELWNDLLASNLEGIILRASKVLDDGTKVLNGQKLERSIAPHLETYVRAYGEDSVNALMQLAELAKAGQLELDRFVAGGQREMLSMLAESAVIASPFGLDVASQTGLAATSAALANEIIRPGGLVKKWLLTDWAQFPEVVRTAQQGLLLGGREVALEAPGAQ